MSVVRATLFAEPPFIVGGNATVGESEAHHLRVVRIGVGERVALRDGAGACAEGTLVKIAKGHAVVELDRVIHIDPPAPIHLLVPVADRDRMLWAAEKAAELGVASWRPVLWQRSKSVTPRGEGTTFRAKVQARMTAAMLQSRGAWLPDLFPESTPEAAVAASPDGTRIVLDALGEPMLNVAITDTAPVTIAVGPEGGFESHELERLVAGGFSACTLGPSILRFETAAVAAVAVARSMLVSAALVR